MAILGQIRYMWAIILCSMYFYGQIFTEESFADYFKPIALDYLYKLYADNGHRRAELDHLFKVDKIYNLQEGTQKKIISYSLFWKATYVSNPQQMVNEQTVYEKNKYIKMNGSFFETYVQPLIEQLKIYKKPFPGWTARLYLAHDLLFLLPQFINLDVEIFVMASNSERAAPGTMWRFLAFDDPNVSAVYVRDADWDNFGGPLTEIKKWIESSETTGFFRLRDTILPRYTSSYSPIAAGCFGGKKIQWLEMEKAMKGFILHRLLYPNEPRHELDKPFELVHPYGFGNRFPDYGFDERFLKHVIYFEALARDQLTIIAAEDLYARNDDLHPWVKADYSYVRHKIVFPKR